MHFTLRATGYAALLAGTLCVLAVVRLALGVSHQFEADGTGGATKQASNVPLVVALLHEASDGHAVFRLDVAIRICDLGHLLNLTDQVLQFTFIPPMLSQIKIGILHSPIAHVSQDA